MGEDLCESAVKPSDPVSYLFMAVVFSVSDWEVNFYPAEKRRACGGG